MYGYTASLNVWLTHIHVDTAFVKTCEFVNSKWNPLSHPELGKFIKFIGKELANGKECKMEAKNAIDLIFKVNQTKGFIVFIN